MYHILREFADSYGLLFLFLVFVGIVAYVFRPGATKVYEHTAEIPFLYDDAPLPPETDKTRHNAKKEA